MLPGIGPTPTIAILLPLTYVLPPVTALIMLAGIFYGAQYGGSTTAILVNLPGKSSSVVTCLDGYQMARNGRAGTALAVAAIGSFIAGTLATFFIAAFAPTLAELAFKFGPPEYFSLMVLGLVGAVVLASGSLYKAFGMIVLGLLLGLVGLDPISGAARFTFGLPQLSDGVNFVALAMGLFALTEIITNLERREVREAFLQRVSGLWLTMEEFRVALPAILRGTMFGSMLGILPGGGAMLSSFAAYALEKRIAKDPSRFGRGAIEGVAGPEAANNAGAQMSFIPLLTLGIPSNAVMALLVGALMIHDIRPGPEVITSNPDLFWGLIASMWIGNLMLVVLNLPLVSIWIKMLSIPYRALYPAIMLFAAVGVYSILGSVFDILLAAGFGVLGYVIFKLACEPAPLILGFVLGPLMEDNLKRTLLLSEGDASVFVSRPISLCLLIVALALLALILLPNLRRKREEVFVE